MSTPSVEQDREEGYRPTVVMLLMWNNMLLIGHEAGVWSFLDKPYSESERWEFGWKIPQGGIEFGETVEQAFFRELKEELTTDYCLLSVEDKDWIQDIQSPAHFRHERQEFPLTRDGVRYRGKSYHYLLSKVNVEWNYEQWTYGPRDDEGPNPSFPVSGFSGGVFFADYLIAQTLIQGNSLGRASTQALSIIHELYAQGLLSRTGCGFRLTTDGKLVGSYGLWEACKYGKELSFV